MRKRERRGETDTLIKEVSEHNKMASLHVDDEKTLGSEEKATDTPQRAGWCEYHLRV